VQYITGYKDFSTGPCGYNLVPMTDCSLCCTIVNANSATIVRMNTVYDNFSRNQLCPVYLESAVSMAKGLMGSNTITGLDGGYTILDREMNQELSTVATLAAPVADGLTN
jgi:hypothetical protein